MRKAFTGNSRIFGSEGGYFSWTQLTRGVRHPQTSSDFSAALSDET